MGLIDIELYPHNQRAYKSALEGWKKDNKVAIVQATGTGKSYLISKIITNFMYEKKIILAPSYYILDHIKSIANGEDINTEYMTYSKLMYSEKEEYSLIVLDEFHRCGAKIWGKEVLKLIEKNPNAKILGTSATPIRFLDNERDMSDELFDGNVVSELSLTDAMAQGILPIPKYISSIFSIREQFDKLEKKVEKSHTDEKSSIAYEVKKLRRRFEKSEGGSSIFSKHIKGKDTKKFIVFCKDVCHLNEMINIVPKWFVNREVEVLKVYSEHLDSEGDFERFVNKETEKDNKVMLLFSIDMLNEGVHVKNVDGIILLRPTISPIIYYQQIGRAIQVGNKKTPLIFDFVNNFNEIGSGQFINDLKESICKLREQGIPTIDVDDFLIVDEVKELKEIFEQIESRLVSSWDYWFKKLCEFKEKYGHTRVPRSNTNTKLNVGLPKWVASQRARKDLLSKEKVDLLNSISFTWSVEQEQWNKMLELCKEYILEHGELTPSVKEVYKGENLGSWVAHQKSAKKQNKLSEERERALNSIGFVWDIEMHTWLKKLNELVEYKDKYGNFDIPKNNEFSLLYHWTNRLKKQLKNNTLPLEMKEYVDKSLGEEFYRYIMPKHERVWLDNLKAYEEAMIDNYVTKNDNIVLWRWANLQRNKRRNETLPQEKIDMLDSIGFIWNERGRIVKNSKANK